MTLQTDGEAGAELGPGPRDGAVSGARGSLPQAPAGGSARPGPWGDRNAQTLQPPSAQHGRSRHPQNRPDPVLPAGSSLSPAAGVVQPGPAGHPLRRSAAAEGDLGPVLLCLCPPRHTSHRESPGSSPGREKGCRRVNPSTVRTDPGLRKPKPGESWEQGQPETQRDSVTEQVTRREKRRERGGQSEALDPAPRPFPTGLQRPPFSVVHILREEKSLSVQLI